LNYWNFGGKERKEQEGEKVTGSAEQTV